MPEFTAVLNESKLFDVFIDGERCYFDMTPNDLAIFATAFLLSNVEKVAEI